MKNKLYLFVTLMVIIPFFGNALRSSCHAQSMAAESLWDKADETGQYHSQNCDYCSKFIGGGSSEEALRNMRNHVWLEHYDEIKNGEEHGNGDSYDDGSSNGDNGSDSGASGSSSNNSYINVIDLELAAEAAQSIGIADKQTFIDNYYCYSQTYLFDKVVYLSTFINFIRYRYGAELFSDIETVIYNYDDYFIFSKYYNYYNYCFYTITTSNDYFVYYNPCEFIYVFK